MSPTISMPDDEFNSTKYVNPAEVAKKVAETPFPIDDELLRDPETGDRKFPTGVTYEAVRASTLGSSVEGLTYAAGLRGELLALAMKAEGDNAFIESAEGRGQLYWWQLQDAAEELRSLGSLPLSRRSGLSRQVALIAKLAFIIGDTSMLSNQLYRSGSPMWMAMLIGISLATSVVMSGGKAGSEIAAAAQRRLRGKPPVNVTSTHISYYDSDCNEAYGDSVWLILACGVTAAMFLSIYFISSSGGDPKGMALGFSFLGALTVLGSAAAQASATNDVADAREEIGKEMEDLTYVLTTDFDRLEREAAEAAAGATILASATALTAASAGNTTMVEADRRASTPQVFGYKDPNASGVTAMPMVEAEPLQLPTRLPSSIQPNRRRRRVLREKSTSPASAADNGVDRLLHKEFQKLGGMEAASVPPSQNGANHCGGVS